MKIFSIVAALALAFASAGVGAGQESEAERLSDAVGSNDINAVKTLLAKNANANSVSGVLRSTPLHDAVENAGKEMILLLLSKGANIDATRTDGQTPLTLSIDAGKGDLAELLISKNANMELATNWDFTPLHMAVYKNKKDLAALLLAKGANINAQPHGSKTPLSLAVNKNNREMIEFLLERKADLGATSQGLSAFDEAIGENNMELAEFLLKRGTPITQKDSKGEQPMYRVAAYGNESMGRYLLERGAKVNGEPSDWRMPIHGTAVFGNIPMAKWLVQNGAKLSSKDKKGNTPLHLAIAFRHADYANWLMDQKVDVKERNSKGETPLHLAAKENQKEVAQRLLANGADINSKNDEGYTPLNQAVSSRSEAVVALLSKSAPAAPKEIASSSRGPLTESEFQSCAKKAVVFDRDSERVNEMVKKRKAGDSSIDLEDIQEEFDLAMERNNAGVDCQGELDARHAIKYCAQSQYQSVWCSRLMSAPQVKAVQERMGSGEALFKKCARRAVGLDGRIKELTRKSGLYESGYSSYVYSELKSEENSIRRETSDFNQECRSIDLPRETKLSYCTHPAYQSSWCEKF